MRVWSILDLTLFIYSRYGFASFDPTRPNFASSLWRHSKSGKIRPLFVSQVKSCPPKNMQKTGQILSADTDGNGRMPISNIETA